MFYVAAYLRKRAKAVRKLISWLPNRAGQEVPADYQLTILSNETVAFYSRTRGTFSVDLEYKSYPFDK